MVSIGFRLLLWRILCFAGIFHIQNIDAPSKLTKIIHPFKNISTILHTLCINKCIFIAQYLLLNKSQCNEPGLDSFLLKLGE